jgi:zinc transport system ATP-binding protein
MREARSADKQFPRPSWERFLVTTSVKRVLSVRNLSIVFAGRRVIHNLSFEVERGESLAIIGPNGAGKTVLLRALLNLVPFEGVIQWAEEIRLGYVPQSIAADRRLPLHVRDLLGAKAHLMKLPPSAISEAAAIVHLAPELLDARVGVLSEPTASLDELAQEHIYELLGELQRNRNLTVLLVSHDLSIVYQFATKVLCLSSAMPCFGPPREILTPETLAAVYSGVPKFYHHVHDHRSIHHE